MKLNHDCVRDLMLLAEETLDMKNFIRCSNLNLEFLDNIRDDSVWKTTKDKLSDFKSASLSFVNNVASQVLASMINQKLGL